MCRRQSQTFRGKIGFSNPDFLQKPASRRIHILAGRNPCGSAFEKRHEKKGAYPFSAFSTTNHTKKRPVRRVSTKTSVVSSFPDSDRSPYSQRIISSPSGVFHRICGEENSFPIASPKGRGVETRESVGVIRNNQFFYSKAYLAKRDVERLSGKLFNPTQEEIKGKKKLNQLIERYKTLVCKARLSIGSI